MRECRKEENNEGSLRWLLTPAFRNLGEEIAEETEKWLLTGRKKVSLVCVNPGKKCFWNMRVVIFSNAIEKSLMRTDNWLLGLTRYRVLETLVRTVK